MASSSLRGQTSLEFLYCTSAVLLLFSMVLLVFFESQQDSAALFAYAESQRLCHAIASQISAISAAGDGTVASLSLPSALGSLNYTAYVSGQNRSLSINYGAQGTGCSFSTSNITNGSSSAFYLSNGAAIRNVNGGLVVN